MRYINAFYALLQICTTTKHNVVILSLCICLCVGFSVLPHIAKARVRKSYAYNAHLYFMLIYQFQRRLSKIACILH